MTEKDSDTISVRWITDGSDDNNYSVRYSFNKTEPDKCQIKESSINRENISGMTLYSAGISVYPGCHVYGTLVKGEKEIQPFFFEIPDNNSGFEFIVLSDLHLPAENETTNEPEIPAVKKIINCINSYDKPSFLVISGDLVNDGYIIPEWKEFFTRTSALLNKTVLYTVPGNHEKNSTCYYDLFGYPQFYSTDISKCRFIFLDSNDNAAALFQQQKELIDETPVNTGSDRNTRMNFIFFHHPPYSSDERHPGGWKNIRKAWGNSIENTPNTIVFSGHVHAYERFETGNATYIVCGTGGGEPYNLGMYPEEKNLPVVSIEDKFGYMKIRVAPGDNSAELSFITPAASGENDNPEKNSYIPEISDYSVTGDHSENNQIMENIMEITNNCPILHHYGG